MVELKGLQQQVTKGKRPFHLHLMLMECTFTSFETSQLEGSYVGDLLFTASPLYPQVLHLGVQLTAIENTKK